MKSESKTTVTSRLIQEEHTNLVLTFTPDEVKSLLAIGHTSHRGRVDFMNKCRGVHNNVERNEACSNLLAEIYFAANDFNKEPK